MVTRTENAAQRKAKARRGGKARGASKMSEVKREVRGVIEAVRTERLDRSVGAVVFQGCNTLLKAAETERRIRETEELEDGIARLEQQQERDENGGGPSWHQRC